MATKEEKYAQWILDMHRMFSKLPLGALGHVLGTPTTVAYTVMYVGDMPDGGRRYRKIEDNYNIRQRREYYNIPWKY